MDKIPDNTELDYDMIEAITPTAAAAMKQIEKNKTVEGCAFRVINRVGENIRYGATVGCDIGKLTTASANNPTVPVVSSYAGGFLGGLTATLGSLVKVPLDMWAEDRTLHKAAQSEKT